MMQQTDDHKNTRLLNKRENPCKLLPQSHIDADLETENQKSDNHHKSGKKNELSENNIPSPIRVMQSSNFRGTCLYLFWESNGDWGGGKQAGE